MRWTNTNIPPWYIVWRLSPFGKDVNKNMQYLGDRDLTLFKHNDYYHFTTYSYTNMKGDGNVNVF